MLSSEQSRGIDLDGRRVRQQRRARAWTQALLAEAAQVSIDTIGRAEKGQAISLENAMAIAGALDRDIAFFRSGQSFAASNIPIRVPEHFLGREDALGSIANALKRYERRVAITALHGMRGVGKTTLAAVYADRHRGDYRATWWIRAQTETTMRADLVTLGIRMGWVGADDKEDEALAAVMERLCHEGEGVLLIYDNAIEARAIAPYLPVGGAAKVLVTSTAHAWRGVAEPIEIGLWPKTTGADYLIARTGRAAEREAGKILSEALGGLPLAHEQVAGYCERLHVSLADYAKRFAAAPARLLDEERHAPTAYHDGRTVAKTFTLAIEEAAKAHPAAKQFIFHAALLAPEPIPLFLFVEAREKFSEPLTAALATARLDEALATLGDFALIDREVITYDRDPAVTIDAIRLHCLVREVAVTCCDIGALEAARNVLLAAVAEVYPHDGYGNPASWARCAALTPHVLTVSEIQFTDREASKQSTALLNAAGNYLHARAAYASTRPLYERALAICEKVLGPEHPYTARTLNNFALLLQDQGNLAGARALSERALAIREKVLGPEHPDTARNLNNLALLLQAQGDFAAARPRFECALAILEKVLGTEHPDTATSTNNLANLLRNQGDRAGARRLYERALAIREKALGLAHPDTATSLDDLGLLLQDEGELAEARPLFERALAIKEKVLGPEHPYTATSLSKLADLLRLLGDPAGARQLVERALAIREKALGLAHPDTATSVSDLARISQIVAKSL